VEAVWEEAVKRGLGAREGTEVLYGGCSAGARGAMFNLDFVERWLNVRVPGKVTRFGGLLDSSFWIDMDPFVKTIPPLRKVAQAAFLLFNAETTVDPMCLYAFAPSEQWKCIFGQYSVPFLRSPYILHGFQDDSYQLTRNGISTPTTPDQLAYTVSFRNLTSFWAHRDVIIEAAPQRHAVVLPACFRHCNTEDSHFSTLTTNGVTLEKALVSWFFAENTVMAFVEDNCVGFNCGPGCAA